MMTIVNTSSSLMVYHSIRSLQLTATLGSYVYINPEIPEAIPMAVEFVVRDNQNPILKLQYQNCKDEATKKQRNRFTLTYMLSQDPERYGINFFNNYSEVEGEVATWIKERRACHVSLIDLVLLERILYFYLLWR